MSRWLEDTLLRTVQGRMRAAARRLRLPLRHRTWRGESGNWQGAGVGSSIDFQDHRPYLPGDDPRYIDWQAYARTGHYTMKLYREEVSPRVDVALDVSASMFFDDAKRERALELFFFCAESALGSGASLRCHAVGRADCVPWTPGVALREAELARAAGTPPVPGDPPAPPALARVPWRPSSLRVLVSDLLFPGSPEESLALLAANRGRAVVFAPYCRAEADPDLGGNVVLTDCESGAQRTQHIDAGVLERYRQSYGRHFAMWADQARRYAVVTARVAAEGSFHDALGMDALRVGAVELT